MDCAKPKRLRSVSIVTHSIADCVRQRRIRSVNMVIHTTVDFVNRHKRRKEMEIGTLFSIVMPMTAYYVLGIVCMRACGRLWYDCKGLNSIGMCVVGIICAVLGSLYPLSLVF